MATYIKKQLDRIVPDGTNLVKVQFVGFGAEKTNWLNLTPEQFDEVKALLIELKKDEG